MPRCEMCGEWPDCLWKIDPEIICGEYHQKPITNADSIRAMTDEELADMFWEFMADSQFKNPYREKAELLDWLKAPVEVDE